MLADTNKSVVSFFVFLFLGMHMIICTLRKRSVQCSYCLYKQRTIILPDTLLYWAQSGQILQPCVLPVNNAIFRLNIKNRDLTLRDIC